MSVHWFGVMAALGFAVGLWLASRRGRSEGVGAEAVLDLGPWLIVGAIVGARALFVATNWREQFAGQPLSEVLGVWHGGLVYYGGLVGASVGCVLYAGRKGLRLWKLADILAPSIALGQVFGRVGCLLNGCCYGRACHLPWAIRFPEGNLMGAPTVPVHPTEIYEAVLDLGLYAALAWLYRRKKFDGQIFGLYLVSYALLRWFVEIFRGDYPQSQHLWGCLTPGQVGSAIILAGGLVLLGTLPRRALSNRSGEVRRKEGT